MLDAYLDGVLEPGQMLDIEGHVTDCVSCRERVELDRATRASLKRSVKTSAPDSLKARALTAMRAEMAREEARSPEKGPGAWRSLVPLASAAALALAFGAVGKGTPSSDSSIHAGLGDDLLAELVAEHSRPLPPDRTDPKDVRAFVQEQTGLAVRPMTFERAGARLVGARVTPMHTQRAAMLQYVIGTGDAAQRVSVFIYDPNKIHVHASELSPRTIGTAEVRVGQSQGFSVAVTQNAGVGYAVASDLDAEHSAQLAALADENY